MDTDKKDAKSIKEDLSHIELNDKFLQALDLMEKSEKNAFITGKAGTGKSTLLNYFRKTTKKKVVVLAPTGVAALNVEGMTIHSFFGFGPDITASMIEKTTGLKKKIYQKLDTIVIDEISMVRADLLDCVETFLRLNGKYPGRKFGGTQMIFIGDLYQLPPVVTGKEKEFFKSQYKSPYFFDAKAFQNMNMEFMELEKIYRQKDQKFINLLNAVRNRSVTEKDIKEINKRIDRDFRPPKEEFYINLTTTNDLSREINEKELIKLAGKLYSFKGKIEGEFDQKHIPTDMELKLKIGSQIMLLNNDISHRWVNGTVGRIKDIKKEGKKELIIVELQNGKTVQVGKFNWTIYKLFYNLKTNNLDSEIIGSFTQFPLKLAWSVTIHKGQGKTFDKVIIDIGNGAFTHGQVYVALSRCTSYEGIVLKKPIEKKHIWMDWKIVSFLTKYQYQISNKKYSPQEKLKMIQDAIANKSKLEITYLKSNDIKSKRTILPKKVGEMEYMGKDYLGVEAYCFLRKDDRVFRVDRILEINKE